VTGTRFKQLLAGATTVDTMVYTWNSASRSWVDAEDRIADKLHEKS